MNVRRGGNRAKGVLAIVVSAFGFALMAAFVRMADDFGSPLSSFQKGFFRNVVALVIALAVLMRSGGVARVFKCAGAASARAWVILVLRSALGSCGLFANFYALSHVAIADGQTLNKTAPFFTVICAWLFLGEKAAVRQIAALALAFLGVVFVAKPGFAGDAAFPLAMGLFGGVCAGGAYACVHALRRHGMEPAFIVVFFSAFSTLAAIPFIAVDFVPMTFSQVAVLLGAGASAAIGQFGITAAYGYAEPREIAVYDYSNIIFTAVLGFAFFGQIPDVWSIIGFVLIVVAAARIGAS